MWSPASSAGAKVRKWKGAAARRRSGMALRRPSLSFRRLHLNAGAGIRGPVRSKLMQFGPARQNHNG